MTSQPAGETERKVAQIRGDVDFLIDHVDGVERRLGRRIADHRRETRAQFAELKSEMGGLKSEVGGLASDVGGLTSQFGEMQAQITDVRATLGEVLRRLPEA